MLRGALWRAARDMLAPRAPLPALLLLLLLLLLMLLAACCWLHRGDSMMLTNSYNESRAQYEKNRNVSDPSEAQRLIDDALEAARFIGGNIVKGVVNPDTGELISVAVVLATLHMAHCRRLDRRN